MFTAFAFKEIENVHISIFYFHLHREADPVPVYTGRLTLSLCTQGGWPCPSVHREADPVPLWHREADPVPLYTGRLTLSLCDTGRLTLSLCTQGGWPCPSGTQGGWPCPSVSLNASLGNPVLSNQFNMTVTFLWPTKQFEWISPQQIYL